MTTHLLGEGVFNWPRMERVSDRYGYVHLQQEWKAMDDPRDVGYVPLARHKGYGQLSASILVTRKSQHIGDIVRGFYPSTPASGETIVLGIGTLDYGTEGNVGLIPQDGRDTDWLDPEALYRCHEQTVQLLFVLCEPRKEHAMPAQSHAWLDALQPGDKVIVSRHLYNPFVGTVTRCTPSQVLVTAPSGQTTRYRRRDGREVGADRPDWLAPYTEEGAADIRLTAMRQTLTSALHKISRTQIDQLTMEECRAVLEVLKAHGLYGAPAVDTTQKGA